LKKKAPPKTSQFVLLLRIPEATKSLLDTLVTILHPTPGLGLPTEVWVFRSGVCALLGGPGKDRLVPTQDLLATLGDPPAGYVLGAGLNELTVGVLKRSAERAQDSETMRLCTDGEGALCRGEEPSDDLAEALLAFYLG